MRYPNWEARLYEVIEEARNKEWKRGKHDCAIFALNAMQAISGIDYGKEIKGKYDTKIGYLKLWKKLGGSTLLEITGIILKKEEEDIRRTRRGDLVLYCDEDKEDHLGICIGDKVAIMSVGDGLIFVDLLDCKCCWRID